jgi:glycosyltransferase involved in cell wall biosynthesis
MERAALAAPHHLHARAADGRQHRDVLAAGTKRTGRRPPGRLDRQKERAGADLEQRIRPLPPNIEAPVGIADSRLKHRLGAAKSDGRLLIGHFGSIYPGKQPNALLEIGAILKQRGLKPLLVYIGSFIRGVDNVEAEFRARARELDLDDDVIVSGFVASDHEVFGLFSEIDAFCYPLDEGITARRSSILTCVQSGHPLIVAGPVLKEEFDHHPRFKELIARGAVVLVARGAGHDVYADRIAAVVKRPHAPFPFDFDGWWKDVAEAILAVIPGREANPESRGSGFASRPGTTKATPSPATAPDNVGRTPPAGT